MCFKAETLREHNSRNIPLKKKHPNEKMLYLKFHEERGNQKKRLTPSEKILVGPRILIPTYNTDSPRECCPGEGWRLCRVISQCREVTEFPAAPEFHTRSGNESSSPQWHLSSMRRVTIPPGKGAGLLLLQSVRHLRAVTCSRVLTHATEHQPKSSIVHE